MTMRYRADITAGALKVPESRVIADLLLQGVDEAGWKDALYHRNVLQTRSARTAERLTLLLRGRLALMDADLWKLVRDGSGTVATHACLAAAIKHSALLVTSSTSWSGSNIHAMPRHSPKLWDEYLADCRGRDPEMPQWSEATSARLRSSVFQILAQAGYIENTRTLKLQPVYIASPVLAYLTDRHEHYVLRCIQVGP